MVSNGVPRSVVTEELGVKKSTLKTWLYKERNSDPFWEPSVKHPMERQAPVLSGRTVADVREVLGMLDSGLTYYGVHAKTGYDLYDIRRWYRDPRYREATLEYDDAFVYDHEDLLDRAVVAQHLCSLAPHVDERLDLLMAAVGFGDSTDDFSIPSRNETRRR